MGKIFTVVYGVLSKKPLYVLSIIIFAQLLTMVYYSAQKKNFHTDEIGTLIASNSLPSAYYAKNKFINSQEVKNVLKIEKNERFRYNLVYENSKKDKGIPPLHTLLIHTAYSIHSFFSDSISKWPGIILNMCFFVFASIVLYFVSRFIFEPDLALLPNLLWGFSSGAISSALFLRMYMMFTLFCVLLLYIVFNIIRSKKAGLKDCAALSLTLYFGIMTHYHFAVWAFLVLTVYFVGVCRRKIPVIVKSVVSIVSAAVLSCLSFPIITNSFNSGHKKWFSENLYGPDNFESIGIFFNLYTKDFFGISFNTAIIAVLAVLLLIAVLFAGKIYFSGNFGEKKILNFKARGLFAVNDRYLFIFCTALSFLFILIVAYTSRFKTPRYIWPVAPVSIIFCLAAAKLLIDRIFNSVFIKHAFLISAVLVFSVSGFFIEKQFSYYYNNDKSFSMSLQYSDLDCIFIANRYHHFQEAFYSVSNFNSVFFTMDEGGLIAGLNELQKKQQAVLVVLKRKDIEIEYTNRIFEIVEQSGWKIEGIVFKKGETVAYRLKFMHNSNEVQN